MTDASRKTAFLFPGQGSQRPGMLDAVPESDSLDRLLDAAEGLTGLPLNQYAADGPSENLADTRVAQPLLYLADYGWGQALFDAGLRPDIMAGHSLGEFAALALAGVFSVEAGLELVVERSRLMAVAAQASPGGMVAVLGTPRELVLKTVEGLDHVWAANDNSPEQIILSGTHQGIERATEALTGAGARKVIALNVAGAFHSPLMQPAADAFAKLLDRTDFHDAEIPVVQNAEPVPAVGAPVIKERLKSQIVRPVRWTETMQTMRAYGVTTMVEAGPGSVLKGLARKLDDVKAVSVEESGLAALLGEIH